MQLRHQMQERVIYNHCLTDHCLTDYSFLTSKSDKMFHSCRKEMTRCCDVWVTSLTGLNFSLA